jgi:two-component system chemotaxis sensor kinase CheA
MQFDIKRFQDTFFTEAAEHLAALETNVLRMEAGDCSPDVLDAIFRSAHSIKGGAGTFDFAEVVGFAHAVETLLDKLRAAEIPASAEIAEALLKSTDALAGLLNAARTNRPAPADAEPIRATLERLLQFPAPKPPPSAGKLFRVQLAPHADAFRRGVDPVLMLRAIRELGVIEESELTSNVPRLAEFDPETCYLAWALRLRTEKSEQELQEELGFFADNVRIAVERIGEPAGAPPKSHPIATTTTSAPKSAPRSQSESPRSSIPKTHPPSTTFFGTYLIDRRLVRVEDVVEALDRQVASQVVLGRIALETERMKTTQVFEALNWAWEHAVLFGEAAVALGFLTPDDVRDLVQLQRSRRKPIGAILADMGVISPELVEKEFLRFDAERAKLLAQAPPPPQEIDSEPQELGENREMLGDFIAEANEHLEAAEQHLLALESDPSRRDALDAIYRGFHTIKGIASFFNLKDITTLAHAAEDLLNVARDGRVVLTGKPLELSLASVDALRRQIDLLRDCLAHGGLLRRDPERSRLVNALQAAVRDPSKPSSISALPRTKPPATRPPASKASIDTEDAPSQRNLSKVAEPKQDSAKSESGPKQEVSGNRATAEWAEKETLKVDRDRLDKLVNVIGELVIGEAMLGQEFADYHAVTGRASVALPQLQKIVRDLQEMSLSLRMVPVGPTFQKMHRIIRDVGKRLGKEIHFHTQGDETEIDKSVVDQIGDPLMHMIRNAADHGIESPEERVKAGKSPQGHVTLRAFHQGGNIFIELEDDGKGLNRSAILRKAVERGLIPEGATLSDAEICDLIFKPGFSTAKEVTSVSGRGVGMDVVRRNVEAIQGTVSVSSREGVGSIITIRLPLTLAIVDGLMVSVSDQTYVLPLVSVIESFRPRPAEVRTVAGKGEIVLVRGEVVPLVRLHQLFAMRSRCTDPCSGLVVIVELDHRKTALLVDELQGQSQVVIKNLEANFRKVDGIAGATILGNGQVALILDVHGLARLSAASGPAVCAPASNEWHSLA